MSNYRSIHNEKLRARKKYFLISHFSFMIVLCSLFFVLSCTRNSQKNSVSEALPEVQPLAVRQSKRLTSELAETRPIARAAAILQTGRQPIWFQLTEAGPVHITSIEDAVYSAAFIPWPLAYHIGFIQERGNELIIVINRDGFLRLAPNNGTTPGIAMYRFSGGEFWRQYTLGAFVLYKNQPAALLYLDDIFLNTNAPPPNPRTWTFNMDSNTPFSLDIPALQQFPAEEGWNIDTLRLGPDGYWYYRAAKRRGSNPEIRMLHVSDLSQTGNAVSLAAFQNSAPRKTEINHPSLPPLPEGFIYTGIGRITDSLFASWEEQENYSIGAAGFVLIKE